MSLGTAQPYIASYVIVRKEGKIAFVLRENTSWMKGFYGLPSGKIEVGESASSAALREAKEEIGIAILPENLIYLMTMQRKDNSSTENEWVDFFFEAKIWDGEVFNAEPHVHSRVEWLDPNDLPENTISSVRFAIEQISKKSPYCEYGWQ